MRILSVDDVQWIRKMIKGTVEALGGELLEASDGMEALTVLEKNVGNIDLILLDLNMPKMDGFDVLRAIKSDHRSSNIPVIMVTTANEKEKIIKAIQAGASNYLIKPFTEQELAKKIQACTGLAHERIIKYFSGAMADVIGAITGLEVQENDGSKEEEAKQGEFLRGQMLVLGQMNVVVFLTMNKESATQLITYANGTPLPELSREELVNKLADIVDRVAVKTKALLAGSGTKLNLDIPFVSVSFTAENRNILSKQKVFKVSKKFRAGELEVFLEAYFL